MHDDLRHDDRVTVSPLVPLLAKVEEASLLGLSLTLADYQALLDELTQAQDLDQQRLNRIYHLEQALDQALTYIEELRQTIKNQQVLENQLAATEEYSYVQQQAIARFKLEIAEQQAALDAKQLEAQQREQAVQELLLTIETMTQSQQQEVEQLRLRLTQDQVEAQSQRQRFGQRVQTLQATISTYQQQIVDLEAETLAAHTLATTFQSQLETAQQQISDLAAQLQKRHPVLPNPALTTAIDQPPETSQTQSFALLRQTLSRARQRIEELERQAAQHLLQQARSQQLYGELTNEREHLQGRVARLEQQTAEMQEQILQQAQQLTEQETAVQYWKDRFTQNRSRLSQTKDQIEQILSSSVASHQPIDHELTHLLTNLLETLNQATDSQSPKPVSLSAIPLPRLATPELPDFLVRRRGRSENVND